jgi:hypothetical protein
LGRAPRHSTIKCKVSFAVQGFQKSKSIMNSGIGAGTWKSSAQPWYAKASLVIPGSKAINGLPGARNLKYMASSEITKEYDW